MIPSFVLLCQKSSPPNARYVVSVRIAGIKHEVHGGRYISLGDAETVTAKMLAEPGVNGTRIIPISGADMYPLS